MGHASFQTTRSYAKYADAHRQSAYDVHLPTVANAKAAGPKLAGQCENEQHVGPAADKPKKESATA
jgi:hypothetical protein